MNKEKLNKLAERYLAENRSEIVFNEIYLELRDDWMNKSSVIAQSLFTDESEILSLYNWTLVNVLKRFNGGDFVNLLTRSLKNARSTLYKKRRRQRGFEVYQADNQSIDEDAPTSEIADTYNLEEEVIKKEIEKRQLLDFFIQAAKPDATTTKIVEAYLQAPPSASPKSIARSIGLHHWFVKRELSRLSRRHDFARFGDFRDYLAV